jgi:hypothetical protein
MSGHFAKRIEIQDAGRGKPIDEMFLLAFGRKPTESERSAFEPYIAEHGLANACRLVFNLNEFSFVD